MHLIKSNRLKNKKIIEKYLLKTGCKWKNGVRESQTPFQATWE
jgi:hypothetical protein